MVIVFFKDKSTLFYCSLKYLCSFKLYKLCKLTTQKAGGEERLKGMVASLKIYLENFYPNPCLQRAQEVAVQKSSLPAAFVSLLSIHPKSLLLQKKLILVPQNQFKEQGSRMRFGDAHLKEPGRLVLKQHTTPTTFQLDSFSRQRQVTVVTPITLKQRIFSQQCLKIVAKI